MTNEFSSVTVEQLLVDVPLPCNLYVFIDSRFITFRAGGDRIDRQTYDRLQIKNITNLFVKQAEHPSFLGWSTDHPQAEPTSPPPPEEQPLQQAREDAHRKTLDIFRTDHPDQAIIAVVASSKKLVGEVMKFPYAVKSLTQLQTFSKGTVDHSVNVSILSIYLAMQMGYSHNVILQNIALGALLHDIGKRKVYEDENATPTETESRMKEHPTYGLRILESMEKENQKIPDEVKKIVVQHHEHADGSGFPKKLRGNAIYDLSRVVIIANMFDKLVGDAEGPLSQRQKEALTKMDQLHYHKFDPDKFEKCMKILALGV